MFWKTIFLYQAEIILFCFQFPHHGDYGGQLSGSAVITSIADMASLLSQVIKSHMIIKLTIF